MLLYIIQVVNQGNGPATGIVVDDTPGVNTTLVVGSVQTSQGSVVSGNTAGDSAVSVNVGNLEGQVSTVEVSFRVRIVDPLPGGVTQVSNQALVSSNELPGVLSDDADTPVLGDPTITPIAAVPILRVTKIDNLLVDLNGEGLPSPGDTLLYEIIIYNNGYAAGTGLVFMDTPGLFTSLVVGSVATERGTVLSGNSAGDSSVSVDIGELPGLRTNLISFLVTIDSPLPSGVETVANQGTLTSNELPPMLTDNPNTAEIDDSTVTLIEAAPDLILVNTDGGGSASTGSTLIYTLDYENSGNQDALGVVLEETVPAFTTFNAAASDPAWVCGDSTPGSICTLTIGSLAVGQSGSVLFAVTIDSSIPGGSGPLRNVATINDDGSNGPDLAFGNNISSDDTPLTTPTAVFMSSSGVRLDGGQPAVFWLLILLMVMMSVSSLVVLRRSR
jgi:uncharacterized repeat protein (TIGR01451 family)